MIESGRDRALALWNFEQVKHATMQIEAWIESHSIRFSIKELSELTGVSPELCKRIVESNPLVDVIYGDMKISGPQKRYQSIAIPPAPTDAGNLEVFNQTERERDEMGREARRDFYELVRLRSLCLHQGKRRKIS